MRLLSRLLPAAALVAACCLPALAAQAAQASSPRWGRLCTVRGDIPVRESPEDSALQVRVLKPGQKVRVDFQEQDWAAVFDPREPERSEVKALGYARMAELTSKGRLELAQATSIEVRRPDEPGAKPEVTVNGKPVKPAAKPAKSAKPAGKAKAAPRKDFGEIRVPDRQLTVRAKRDKDSEFRRVLTPGQRVRVDYQGDGWYAVFAPDEKTRELSRAWGYSRDKYLVPEAAYKGPAVEPPAPKAAPAPAPEPAQKAQKPKAEADDAIGYAVLERKADRKKSSSVTLRVRLELAEAPAHELLRKIAREIWKAEHKKGEHIQLDFLLAGMDPKGLAYAVARFDDEGRLREFWWRDVVVGKGRK